jgi:hypothetical protein
VPGLWAVRDLEAKAEGADVTSPIEAVCIAAGWDYCAEHNRPLVHGSNPCGHLHRVTEQQPCMACFDAGIDFDWCRVCGRGKRPADG